MRSRSIPPRSGIIAWVTILLLAADVGSAEPAPDRPVVHVAYFVPADRNPEPDYRARLDRVMSEVQRFYRDGMDENGHGKIAFELDRDPKGGLRIHEVRGVGPMRDYGRDGSSKVLREVKAALAREGLNIDHETVVIFQLLLEWQGDKAVEIGPYVGRGGPGGSYAWVYDDAKLDPRLLPSRDPGGYYRGPCSIGQFNTHYIGGVIHELGHAFGLPHDRERDADRPRRGSSVMGHGNHTYGQEKRGEGKGAFLSAASALPLSVHPLFTGKRASPAAPTPRFTELEAAHEGGELLLTGRLQGGPRVVGLVALNDSVQRAKDYDAVGWVGSADTDGRFRLAIGGLEPGAYDLSVAAYCEGGTSRRFRLRYSVDRQRRPDLRPFAEAEREFAVHLPAYLTPGRRKQNLLAGGSFEDGAGVGWSARSWRKDRGAVRVTDEAAKEGKRSASIRSAGGNDASFDQKVNVTPNTRYLLSGWIKTKGVEVVEPGGSTGANLSLGGGYEASDSVVGDTDWTYSTLLFDSGTRTEIVVRVRLGFTRSAAKGEAWFDDIVLVEVGKAPSPN